MKRFANFCLPLVLALACTPAIAALSVDAIFGDHMVIQRDKPVVVFGSAVAGESVRVTFGQDSVMAQASASGRWIVKLPARPANAVPAEIRVDSAGSALVLKDVLVGDVWVAAGQSNMEFPLDQDVEGGAELQAAADDAVRVASFRAPSIAVGAKPLDQVSVKLVEADRLYAGGWAIAAGKAASSASAVAYWFAKKVRAETGLPIGIVGYAIGGAPLESFISREALQAGGFGKKLSGDWMHNPELPNWVRSRGAQNLADVAGVPSDALGRNHAYKPALAWEAGMGRITAFPIRGFLWYQGESNAIEAGRVAEYPELQRVMVADWRARWGDDKLPFYFVQLSSCEDSNRMRWGEFRDLQRRAVDLIPAPSGMAVSYDFGPPPATKGDVHPAQKRPVGERLALLALRDVYGKPGLVAEGPQPMAATKAGDGVRIRFGSATGLAAKSDDVAGFEISDDGIQFVPAVATIGGGTVTLRADGVKSPTVVRYAWAPWTRDANLVNGAGLPAPTFTMQIK
ncbi:sialate O-acetylesterase [Paucibacter sp. AS339]|uniref:sialate O-acetylesterase n=1 Tax=Paucibacter hankyongi TaxID=3133434 RepID=UPI00309AB8CA